MADLIAIQTADSTLVPCTSIVRVVPVLCEICILAPSKRHLSASAYRGIEFQMPQNLDSASSTSFDFTKSGRMSFDNLSKAMIIGLYFAGKPQA